jgi:hypothetical protein
VGEKNSAIAGREALSKKRTQETVATVTAARAAAINIAGLRNALARVLKAASRNALTSGRPLLCLKALNSV